MRRRPVFAFCSSPIPTVEVEGCRTRVGVWGIAQHGRLRVFFLRRDSRAFARWLPLLSAGRVTLAARDGRGRLSWRATARVKFAGQAAGSPSLTVERLRPLRPRK